MNRAKFAAIVLAITVVGLALAGAGSARAADEQDVLTNYPVLVSCVSSGQLCSPAFSVLVDTERTLRIQFTASAGHCSKIRVFIYVNSVLVHTSGFLDPGQSTAVVDLSPVSPGSYTISVQAEGTTDPVTGDGTCNSGSLGGWAGNLAVVTGGEQPPLPPESRLFFRPSGGAGAAAAVVAAAARSAAQNRARAAQAAQTPPLPAPSVTAPRTGTGISLPNTGDGGLLRESNGMQWWAYAVALVAAAPLLVATGRLVRGRRQDRG